MAPAGRFLTRHDCASAQMEGIWRRSACHQNLKVVQTPQQRGNVAAAYLSADLLPVMSVASRSALLALLRRAASLTVRERECNGSITRDCSREAVPLSIPLHRPPRPGSPTPPHRCEIEDDGSGNISVTRLRSRWVEAFHAAFLCPERERSEQPKGDRNPSLDDRWRVATRPSGGLRVGDCRRR